MLFVIHALDLPRTDALRQEHYAAHKAFLPTAETFGVRIVLAGPLVKDDGTTPVGSHIVVEADSREVVEKFHQADPFFKFRIWDKATITAFIKRLG